MSIGPRMRTIGTFMAVSVLACVLGIRPVEAQVNCQEILTRLLTSTPWEMGPGQAEQLTNFYNTYCHGGGAGLQSLPPQSVCPLNTTYCSNTNQCCNPGFYCSRYGCTPDGAIECGSYYCKRGQACASDGKCMMAGDVDCGNGKTCPAEHICTNDGCLSRKAARVCSSGSYCNEDEVCTAKGTCLSNASPRICHDGRICGDGTVCSADNMCISRASGRVCSDGRYCEDGSICTADNACLSAKSDRVCTNGKSYCSEGFYCGASGKCMRVGSIECGNHACLPGFYCGSNDVCMQEGADDCGGGHYCPSGNVCVNGDKCMLRGNTACGDHSCGAGFYCGSKNSCMATGAVDCGNGRSCPNGTECRGGGECLTTTQLEARTKQEQASLLKQQMEHEEVRRRLEADEKQTTSSSAECETAYEMIVDFGVPRQHWAPECPGGIRPKGSPTPIPGTLIPSTGRPVPFNPEGPIKGGTPPGTSVPAESKKLNSNMVDTRFLAPIIPPKAPTRDVFTGISINASAGVFNQMEGRSSPEPDLRYLPIANPEINLGVVTAVGAVLAAVRGPGAAVGSMERTDKYLGLYGDVADGLKTANDIAEHKGTVIIANDFAADSWDLFNAAVLPDASPVVSEGAAIVEQHLTTGAEAALSNVIYDEYYK